MKKITSTTGSTIRFRVNGSVTLLIDEAGVVASDDHAAIVADRLGDQVSISDTEQASTDSDIVVDPTLIPPVDEPAPVIDTPDAPSAETTPAPAPDAPAPDAPAPDAPAPDAPVQA